MHILRNTFLFDAVADPLEHGNLKERQPNKFAELADPWERWNGGMLTHPDETPSAGFTGDVMADHFGAGLVNRDRGILS